MCKDKEHCVVRANGGSMLTMDESMSLNSSSIPYLRVTKRQSHDLTVTILYT